MLQEACLGFEDFEGWVLGCMVLRVEGLGCSV